MNLCDILHTYLEKPDNDTFFSADNTALIWIDWREYDEDIAAYINQKLAPADRYRIELVNNGKAYGDDIVLKTAAQTLTIPYPPERMERDITLHAVADFIAPAYRLCWCKETVGDDTFAFIVLPDDDYRRLCEQHGADKCAYYFPLVAAEEKLFALDMDETQKLVNAREHGYEAYLERQTRLLTLEGQYARGEIDRKTYRARKNELEGVTRKLP